LSTYFSHQHSLTKLWKHQLKNLIFAFLSLNFNLFSKIMKRYLVSMAAIAMAATAVAQLVAQPQQPQITYAGHALTAGDVHKTLTVKFCDPQSEGANQVWDYSAATISNEPPFEESLATGTDGKNIAVGNTQGVSFSFNVTPQGNEYWGYKHGNHSMVFDQPILKTRFPQAYLDQHSGEFSGRYIYTDANITNIVTMTINGTYSTTVDGYGTIILPGGKVFKDVLRVKTYDVCSDGYVVEKYLWYSAVLRYPIFVTHIVSVTQGERSRVTQSSHVSVAALEYVAPSSAEKSAADDALATKFAYDIYPNPVETETQITYTLAAPAKVSVKAYDVNGMLQEVVVEASQKEGTYQYTYAPAMAGIYFVVLEVGGERISKQVVKK
jgi:hypothetical protein